MHLYKRLDLAHPLSCSGAPALHSSAPPYLPNFGPFSAQPPLPLKWGTDCIIPITCLLFLFSVTLLILLSSPRKPPSHSQNHTNPSMLSTVLSPPQSLWYHSVQGLSHRKSQHALGISGGKSCLSEQAGSPSREKYISHTFLSLKCLSLCLTMTGLNKGLLSKHLYSFCLAQHPAVPMTSRQLLWEDMWMNIFVQHTNLY